MSILSANDDGVFFEPTLLKHMRLKNNAEILAIVKNTDNLCQLRDSSGKTLLHFAAEYGNDKFAEHLIDSGAEVDPRDRMQRTPLMLAVDAGRLLSMRVLIKANADIFTPDVNGLCVLKRAAVNNREKSYCSFELFLMHMLRGKVTVDSLKASEYAASDEFLRDYPLYYVMQLKDAEVTRFLLERGSPVNAKDPSTRQTALHLAVQLNCLENVQLLLEYNADVNAVDHFELTPLLSVLRLYGDEEDTPKIMKLLIDRGGTMTDPVSRRLVIEKLFMFGSRAVIRTLLQYPIDLESELAPSDFTPLYWLCLNPIPNVLEELKDFDFDVNLRDKDDCTLLHHAARIGNASSVQFLLSRGADVNARNVSNDTPLFSIFDRFIQYLHKHHLHNYPRCIEILLDYGADPLLYTTDSNRDDYADYLNQLMTPILAKLALLDASDRPIEMIMRNYIESKLQLKTVFEAAQRQLEEMKQLKILNSITLFDILSADANDISRFARNKCLVANLSKVLANFNTMSYYHRILQRYSTKLCQLIEFRDTFLPVINEVLAKFCNLSLHNVAELIVDYLQDGKC